MKRFFIIIIIASLAALLLWRSQTGAKDLIATGNKDNQIRLISVSPNITEIMFALELSDETVGVTDFCNYPPAATEKQSIGSIMEPDFETILALKPTNVFITNTAFHTALSERLSKLGLNVEMFDVDMLEGITATISRIGEITGHIQESCRLNQNIREGLNAIKDKAALFDKTPTMLIVIQPEPLIVFGKNTYIDELITLAGGTNAITEPRHMYPVLNAEALVMLNPDIIVQVQPDADTVRSSKALANYKLDIEAVRNKNVFSADADLLSRPGPRVIEAGLAMQRVVELYMEEQ